MPDWSEWRPFPDPREFGVLSAPFGAGVYDFRRKSSGKAVLFGVSGHVAARLTSILPKPHGTGTRNNDKKRSYCLEHLADLEYRTLACATRKEAADIDRSIKKERGHEYEFKT